MPNEGNGNVRLYDTGRSDLTADLHIRLFPKLYCVFIIPRKGMQLLYASAEDAGKLVEGRINGQVTAKGYIIPLSSYHLALYRHDVKREHWPKVDYSKLTTDEIGRAGEDMVQHWFTHKVLSLMFYLEHLECERHDDLKTQYSGIDLTMRATCTVQVKIELYSENLFLQMSERRLKTR